MEVKNVLVVDDDESIIDLFNLVGKKLGLNIIPAENGQQGFRAFSYYDFFMAITDLNMPKMNGVELIKKVRGIPKYRNFPFLILSGNLNDFDSDVAFLENVDIKEKPITKDDIEKIFRNKLMVFDDTAKTVNEKELIKKIEDAIKAPCDLLLNIVTRDPGNHEKVKVKKDSQFLNSDFFAVYPAFIAGNKITFIMSFEKELARAIKFGVDPSRTEEKEEDQDIIFSLHKALNPLLMKVFEAIGHPLDYSHTNLPTIFGNCKSASIYSYDYGNILHSAKFTNKYGSMQVYIVYEA